MTKRRPFKKAKPGEPIPVTAQQLENFMLEHNGRFNSRDYDKFERMELMESKSAKKFGNRPLFLLIVPKVKHNETMLINEKKKSS